MALDGRYTEFESPSWVILGEGERGPVRARRAEDSSVRC